MADTRELRIKARKLGLSNPREYSREELEDYISEHSQSNGKGKKKMATATVKKAVKAKRGPGRPRKDADEDAPRRRGRPKGSKNRVREEIEDDEDEAPVRRRGRPKGSGKKAAESAPKRRGRPAKAERGSDTSKRSKGAVGRPPGSGTGTRVALREKINWNKSFDFRDGSTSAFILAAIRKAAKRYDETWEIRENVFEKLVDKINKVDELTFMNRSEGRPWKGEKAEQRLRYYINRTMFDYASETGQHDGSSSYTRVEKTTTKGKNNVKRGPGRPRKVVDEDEDEDETPRRRGRPKGSTTKRRGPGRPPKSELAPKRRGRPPGSKNRVKDDSTPKRRGRPPGSKNKPKLRARG